MAGFIMTSSGFWNPVLWIAAMIVMAVIAYVIRSGGNNRHKEGTQRLPFYSGNKVERSHIKAGNIYWGFFETLERYYTLLRRMHTGIVNDYVYSFVIVVVVLAVIMLGVSA